MFRSFPLSVVAGALVLTVIYGCGPSGTSESGTSSSGSPGKTTLLAVGSDTMVNLAQAWAEAYHKVNPNVTIQVRGGGSGVGISSLINGTCDLANASRKMKQKEKDLVKSKLSKEAKEHIVGYDALAVYAHKYNPVDAISIEELAEIYGDGGKIEEWSGVSPAAAKVGEIIRVSRQNNSGTYVYFREAVLGKGRDYKLGSIDQSGSKDVVALVSKTPGAIGYSGMGYATPEVKMLEISKAKGGESVAPTVENAKKGTYPITRPLHIYTVGEPSGILKEYIDWIMSAEGQKVVLELGYVPVN